ncbi:hypothetical protein GOBAR_AA37905 [Gossypium barbadense]|uniref:Uncharacterized protein n=1 Tax=Gossypium barbadense TaxID=3634 RepID=A0A2P5VVE1_GOSBA|nr:hypothetical protein GOBAR_AA37905 [Gossypium barbadense]
MKITQSGMFMNDDNAREADLIYLRPRLHIMDFSWTPRQVEHKMATLLVGRIEYMTPATTPQLVVLICNFGMRCFQQVGTLTREWQSTSSCCNQNVDFERSTNLKEGDVHPSVMGHLTPIDVGGFENEKDTESHVNLNPAV